MHLDLLTEYRNLRLGSLDSRSVPPDFETELRMHLTPQ